MPAPDKVLLGFTEDEPSDEPQFIDHVRIDADEDAGIYLVVFLSGMTPGQNFDLNIQVKAFDKAGKELDFDGVTSEAHGLGTAKLRVDCQLPEVEPGRVEAKVFVDGKLLGAAQLVVMRRAH